MGTSPVSINPTTGQPQILGANGQPVSSGGGSATSTPSIDYSQLLPSASELASFTPLPYQSFGSVPQTQAATVDPASVASTPNMQAASVDLSSMPGALSSYESLNQQALAPTFQQQSDALTANEADRGIFNSTAASQLGNNLAGQQDAALASADAPLVSQMEGAYTSGEQLNAQNQQAANTTNYTGSQDYNTLVAELQQQAGLSNQSALNNSNNFNATAYGDVVGGNMNDYNQYLNSLYQNQTSTQNGLAGDVISSYSPSQYEQLLTTGLNSAGNAASNAYNAGSAGTANLSSSLGSIFGNLASGGASGAAGGLGAADAGYFADAGFGGDDMALLAATS